MAKKMKQNAKLIADGSIGQGGFDYEEMSKDHVVEKAYSL